MLLCLLVFFFAYHCTALPAGDETSVNHAVLPRQREPTQQVPGGLFNPYRIAQTPLSLDFNSTGDGLDRVDMVRAFSNFQRVAAKHIKETGDSPIPPRVSMGVHNVRLEVRRRPKEIPGYPLTWNLAKEVVKAVSVKMHTEGFKARTCNVLLAENDELVLGFVRKKNGNLDALPVFLRELLEEMDWRKYDKPRRNRGV
ncbi:MAG: hypothetical protein Q9169_005729 [Polycauliona sp. 2 TL-2023]